RGRIFTADSTGTLLVSDAETGKPISSLPGVVAEPPGLATSPDSSLLAWIARDATVHLLDVASGKERQVLEKVGRPRALTFSPDGRTLAVTSAVDAVSEAAVHLFRLPGVKPTRSVAVPISGAFA